MRAWHKNFDDVYHTLKKKTENSLLVRKRECFPVPNKQRPDHKISHKKRRTATKLFSMFVPKMPPAPAKVKKNRRT